MQFFRALFRRLIFGRIHKMENIEIPENSSNHSEDQSAYDSDDERNRVNELFSSIRSGNLHAVRKLLEEGVKTNVIDRNNKDNTPLHYAIEKRRKEIVEELLLPKWKTDVNAINSKGDTPLHIAAFKGEKDLVKLILNSHAAVDVENHERKTPLDLATDVEIANILEQGYVLSLKTGLFMKSSIPEDSNSLYWAVALAYLTAAKHDGNIFQQKFAKLFGGTESLELVQKIRDLFLAHSPMENSRPICTDENLRRLALERFRDRVLHEISSHRKEFEENITFSACLDSRNENFKSQQFKMKAHSDCMREVLSCDPYFKLQMISKLLGCNVLLFFYDSEQIVKHIKYAGCNDRIQLFCDCDGHFEFGLIKASELIQAIRSNQIRKSEFYFNLGIDNVNYRDNANWTPLHFAASRGLTNIIELLLASGAHIDVKNCLQQNPLDVAQLFDKKCAVQMLMKESDKLSDCNQRDPNSDQLSVQQNPVNEEIPTETEQSKNNPETFCKRKGTSNMSGQLYEIHLCMLFLLQALKKHQDGKIKTFRLATNVDQLEDFDDIFFEYNYEEENGTKQVQKEKSKTIFLQAKHIGNVKKKKITMDVLLTGSKANRFSQKFNLKKYFHSYRSIKQKFLKGTVFRSQFEDDDREFIIYTNAMSNFSEKDNINITEIDKMHILHLGSTRDNNNYYELSSPGNEKELMNALLCSVHYDEDSKITSISEENSPTETRKKKKLEDDSMQGEEPSISFRNASVQKSEIRDFLSKLKMFIDQPNEELLSEIIQQKIQIFYGVQQQEANFVFSDVRLKVENWWKNSNHFLTESNRFFQDSVGISIQFQVKNPVFLFTGRSESLIELHNLIQCSNTKVMSVSNVTVISGPRGSGKTELAKQYIHQYRHDYDDNIIWIDAESEGSLIKSFILLARDKLQISVKNSDTKDIKIILEEVYSYFNKRKSLFVFHNSDKEKTLREFLPQYPTKPFQNKPYILVTSRHQEWELEEKVIHLGYFGITDGVEFVKKGLGISSEETSQDRFIRQLVMKLKRCPLAIQQAIAYIAYQQITRKIFLRNYLREYDGLQNISKSKKHFETFRNIFLAMSLDFETFPARIDKEYAKATFETWKITADKILSEKYGELAVRILEVVSYFRPQNIKIFIFLDLADNNEGKLRSAVRLLVKYSLVRGEQQQSILSIHTLLQEVIRLELKELEKEEEILMATLKMLETRIDSDTVDHALSVFNHASKYNELMKQYAHISCDIVLELIRSVRYKEAHSFATKVLKLLQKLKSDSDYVSNGKLFTKSLVALVLFKQGKHEESLIICKVLYDMKKEIFGQNHPVTLHKKSCIAKILFSQGKFQEALQSYEEILDDGKDVWAEIHRYRLVIKREIARIFLCQSKYDEALKVLKEVLTAEETTLGRNNFQTLETKKTIADVLVKKDKHGKALKIYRKLYKIKKSTFGETSCDVLNIRKNIVAVLNRQGKYKKAQELYKKVLNTENKCFAEDRLNILCTKYLAAEEYPRMGIDAKALEAIEQVFREREEILGISHLRTLDAEQSVADTLSALGEYDKAFEHYDNVLEHRMSTLGSDHSDVLTTRNSIGELLLKQCKYQQALPILKEVYSKRKCLLGELHIATLTSKNNVAMALLMNRRYDEALELYLEILKGYKTVFGEKNPCVFSTNENIALLLSEKGEEKKALELLELVFRERANIWGDTDPETLTVQRNIARLYIKLHNPIEAQKLLYRIMDIEKNQSDYFSILNTESCIADAWAEAGNYGLAVKMYQEVLDKRIKAYGETNLETLAIRCNMGSALVGQGEYKEGLEIYRNVLKNQKAILPPQDPDITKTWVSLDKSLKKIGWTRLHLAAYDGDEAEMTSILDEGNDINCRTKVGSKAVHLAVKNNNKEALSTLISYSKKQHPQQLCSFINDKAEPTGETALHMAVSKDNHEIVEILLRNGANYDLEDKRRKFPLDLARPGSDVQNILQCIDSLFTAVRDGKKDEVNALLESQQNLGTLKVILHARDRDEQTLINVAVNKHRGDIAEMLINKMKDLPSTA